MAKTKEEFMEMSVEDLTEYILKQQEIKQSMTDDQTKLKEKLASTNTELEEFKTKQAEIDNAQKLENEKKLLERVGSLNVKEKFANDLISKTELSLDMNDKEFNEAISKTLEKYPEYKEQHESINAPDPEEVKEHKTYGEDYRDLIDSAKNKNKK